MLRRAPQARRVMMAHSLRLSMYRSMPPVRIAVASPSSKEKCSLRSWRSLRPGPLRGTIVQEKSMFLRSISCLSSARHFRSADSRVTSSTPATSRPDSATSRSRSSTKDPELAGDARAYGSRIPIRSILRPAAKAKSAAVSRLAPRGYSLMVAAAGDVSDRRSISVHPCRMDLSFDCESAIPRHAGETKGDSRNDDGKLVEYQLAPSPSEQVTNRGQALPLKFSGNCHSLNRPSLAQGASHSAIYKLFAYISLNTGG